VEILVQEPIDLSQVADLAAVGIERTTPTPRDGSKWHVTSLLRSGHRIAKGDVGYEDNRAFPDDILAIMALGRIWETTVDCFLTDYADCRGGLYVSDVESVTDGIIASLDGLMWLPDMGWMVAETKLRYTLNENIPSDHIQQVRAYCHCADTNLVCYVSGHISTAPPTVRARLRILRLTRQSIEECWQGIINTRDYLVAQGCGPNDGRGE